MNTTSNKRLLALDVMRGITIAGMILVNNPGSWGHAYAPLKHAQWNGLTPTDLVSLSSCLSWESPPTSHLKSITLHSVLRLP